MHAPAERTPAGMLLRLLLSLPTAPLLVPLLPRLPLLLSPMLIVGALLPALLLLQKPRHNMHAPTGRTPAGMLLWLLLAALLIITFACGVVHTIATMCQSTAKVRLASAGVIAARLASVHMAGAATPVMSATPVTLPSAGAAAVAGADGSTALMALIITSEVEEADPSGTLPVVAPAEAP